MYKMIFKQRFLQRNRNKKELLLECIDVLLQIAVLFFLYKGVFGNKEYINSISFQQVMTYIVVAVIVEELAYINGIKLVNLVSRGKMSYELLKPYSFPIKVIVEAAADFCAGIIWKCVPMLIIVIWAIKPAAPKSPVHAILFIISTILGVFVLWGIQMALQMFGFWFRDMINVFMVMSTVYKLLGGMFIPYCLLPERLGNFLLATPFAYIWHIPMEIYFGRLSGGMILPGMLMQLVWILLLAMLIKHLYKRGKRSLQVAN